jgi:hypothetical protein
MFQRYLKILVNFNLFREFLYDINHLNFLEKNDCEQILKILLKDEMIGSSY